jgi:hypothetical protein
MALVLLAVCIWLFPDIREMPEQVKAGIESVQLPAICREVQAAPAPAEESPITFAPGETQKVITLVPNQWSPWIVTPPETKYRTDTPSGTLVRFVDGETVRDMPFRYFGIKRGVFKLKSPLVGEAVVTIEYPRSP